MEGNDGLSSSADGGDGALKAGRLKRKESRAIGRGRKVDVAVVYYGGETRVALLEYEYVGRLSVGIGMLGDRRAVVGVQRERGIIVM